ncbi:DsrE family protein [Salinibaculum rarum]|jgi:intracellular sulfur oxidation DsrE/DsrF family protein|uniref:DsrE family protein n=1 Tax=Salinibaculum rarum TaxID=3058903 RepID=UPI0026605BA0|nr:DsrE family protein [Salinibaculum sp. KK48]
MSNPDGIVIHVTSGESEDWQTALRNLRNLAQDNSVSTPPELIRVVVNGPAVRFLLAGAPEASRIARMVEAGVQIRACSNSLERFGYATDEVVEGVETVQSGVAQAVRLQQRGSAYLKLP